MGREMLNQSVRDIAVDFSVETDEQNTTKVLDTLDNLESEIDGYKGSFAMYYTNYYNMFLQKGPEEMDWVQILNNSDSDNADPYSYSMTHFFGIKNNIFNDTALDDRFESLISFSEDHPLLNQSGFYLDDQTADNLNVSQGDLIHIGQLYQYWDYEVEIQYNYTANVNNVSVLGIFTIHDKEYFMKNMQNENYPAYSQNDRVCLGNFNYTKTVQAALNSSIHNQVESDGFSYNRYDPSSLFYGIFIDHNALDLLNTQALQNQLIRIRTRIIQLDPTMDFIVFTRMEGRLSDINTQLIFYRILFVIISLPVIILGWFLCKTNYFLSYRKRRREIALLKCKGATKKKLSRTFLLEAVAIGSFGGVLGVVGGQITSKFMLERIYATTIQSFSFAHVFLNGSNWLLGILFGVVLSLLAVIKPLKEYLNMVPIEGIRLYHEGSQTEIPRKKRDYAIFLLGLIPIILELVPITNDYYNPIYYTLLGISSALLPLSPFLLIYGIVKLICSSTHVFEKIITSLSKLFGKKYSKLSSKDILQNRARSFRLVFIVSLSLSFVLMASTLQASELRYQENVDVIMKGNGIRAGVYSWQDNSLLVDDYVEGINSEPLNGSIDDVVYYFNYEGGTIKGYEPDDDYQILQDYSAGQTTRNYPDYYNIGVATMNFRNLSKHIEFKEEWFEGNTSESIINQLHQRDDVALFPEQLKEKGYKIKDQVTLQYSNASKMTGTSEKSVEIIGFYSLFPIASVYQYSPSVLIPNATIYDGDFSNIDFVVYPKQETLIRNVSYKEISKALKSVNPSAYISNPVENYEEQNMFFKSTVNFLDLESYYLLTIVVFAIGVIMYISVTEKRREFAIMRARGVDKKETFKIQLSEGTILLLFGGFLGLLGILGARGAIVSINNLSLGGLFERSLYIPWRKIFLQLCIIIVLFIITIGISVQLENRKSKIGEIPKTLRVQR